MKYLLTIPARNEGLTIGRVISQFLKEAKNLGITLDLQVIDDHSVDNTQEVVENMGIPVYRVTKGSGLAAAFRAELRAALRTDADCVIHVDADGQYSETDLKSFVSAISEGYDLVLGNRLHARPAGMSDIRFQGNILLSKFVSFLVGQNISDTQTGFRAMRREVVKTCRIISKYTYTQEQIIRTLHAGFRLKEVPICFGPRVEGPSRLMRSPFQYLTRVFEDMEKVVSELRPELLEYVTPESTQAYDEKD